MVFGGSKAMPGRLFKYVRAIKEDRADIGALLTSLQGHWQGRCMSHLVEIMQDLDTTGKRKFSSLHGFFEDPSYRPGLSKSGAKRRVDVMTLPPPMSFSNYVTIQSQDLRRFLEEVGTDPKEARYWLRQFQRSSEPCHPFAVIYVDEDLLEDREMLDRLASSVSFLHRNNMKCVMVHGLKMNGKTPITPETLQDMKTGMTNSSMMLASVLESHGVHSRPLFCGSGVIQAYTCASDGLRGKIGSVNCDPIKWVMMSGHVPIIHCIGETSLGQLVSVDINEVLMNLSIALQPRKVLIVNTRGGLKDEHKDVIANLNLPLDPDVEDKSWVTSEVKDQLKRITEMLEQLPQQSSVVITSASTVLTELFTHHGSGTFFKIAESLRIVKSLEDVNIGDLNLLLNKSFGKDLKNNYFEDMEKSLDRLYISERYNAAAIILKIEGISAAYLDKFAVSSAKQGEGVADDLWQSLKRDYKSLFWRAKVSNKINNWYFKKCDGSWSNGEWIVFWYGVASHSESSQLVDYALSLPATFVEASSPEICDLNEGKKLN